MSYAIAIVLYLLAAAVTASVADSKGRNGAVWFLIGLVAPALGLLLALLALPPMGFGHAPMPSPEEAAQHSPVARLLAGTDGLSVRELVGRMNGTEQDVTEQLAALRALGFVTRDGRGIWGLTVDGHAALAV